jgi:hypothetical protein
MKPFPRSFWFTRKKRGALYPSSLQTWDLNTGDCKEIFQNFPAEDISKNFCDIPLIMCEATKLRHLTKLPDTGGVVLT